MVQCISVVLVTEPEGCIRYINRANFASVDLDCIVQTSKRRQLDVATKNNVPTCFTFTLCQVLLPSSALSQLLDHCLSEKCLCTEPKYTIDPHCADLGGELLAEKPISGWQHAATCPAFCTLSHTLLSHGLRPSVLQGSSNSAHNHVVIDVPSFVL